MHRGLVPTVWFLQALLRMKPLTVVSVASWRNVLSACWRRLGSALVEVRQTRITA